MDLFKIDFGWTKANIKNIAWHAAVVGIAAIITYLLELLPSAEFGVYTPFITMGISWTLKSILEYVKKA